MPIGAVDSPPLAKIVHWMDQVSDNFVAEMLVKELGAVQGGRGTTAAGVGLITGLLAQAGVPLDGVRLVDGSGLSLLDRLTPEALAVTPLDDVERRRGAPRAAVVPARGRAGPERCTTGCGAAPRRASCARRPARRRTRPRSPASPATATSSRSSRTAGPSPASWARVAQDRFATVLAAAQ